MYGLARGAVYCTVLYYTIAAMKDTKERKKEGREKEGRKEGKNMRRERSKEGREGWRVAAGALDVGYCCRRFGEGVVECNEEVAQGEDHDCHRYCDPHDASARKTLLPYTHMTNM